MSTTDSFSALPLAAPLQRALSAKGYTTPSPIQAQAIPHLLEGRDLLGAAQTGTGKTAAFALPILHHLQANLRPLQRYRCRALILTPTRELAVQVAASFEAYGQHLRLSTALVYGGVGAGPQISRMRRGVDILVATPGRLLDLYGQEYIELDRVEFFVLDEADRMLDMGFIADIRKVVAQLPQARQSLFFSATMAEEITRLAHEILRDPVEVRIAPQAPAAERVNHRLCFVTKENKLPLLHDLLDEQKARPGRNLCLVFARTKHGADRLAKQLGREGVRAEAIHGNKSQGARQRALENFRSGRAPVLVATDVAARGIDVKDISLVVNFDLPQEPEAYVHRIGRTARAGAEGEARTFCTSADAAELRPIERLLGMEIPAFTEHAYHDETAASLRQQRRPQKSRQGPRKGGFRPGGQKSFRHARKPYGKRPASHG